MSTWISFHLFLKVQSIIMRFTNQSIPGVWCGMLLFLGISPQLMMVHGRSLGGRNLQGANTIRICVEEMILTTPRIAEGARVKCWDKDPNGDDVMCEGTTGQNGCVVMNYKKQSWDGLLGGRSADIYCSVNKIGFVQSVPADKDHHDQTQEADFGTVMLYRDRSNDAGHTNGCGPAFTEYLGNYLISFLSNFGDQCEMHDKCYWDCQIFLAMNSDRTAAQHFCDFEMKQGMDSYCHMNNGDFPGIGEDGCLLRSSAIYTGLQAVGGAVAYDKTAKNCPKLPDGKTAESMENDYSHLHCSPDGYMCGYDGTTGDDLKDCNGCCSANQFAIDEGTSWDDHYCKCFPKNIKCRSSFFTNNFNKCGSCCSGSNREDAGWTYSDWYCN